MRYASLLPVVISLTLSACHHSYSSNEVCDCRFIDPGSSDSWVALKRPPANYRHSEIRSLFDNDDPVYGTLALFDDADTHWYKNESGEPAACIVFKSSQRVNALLVLPADVSATEPKDFRILGIPFGREEDCG